MFKRLSKHAALAMCAGGYAVALLAAAGVIISASALPVVWAIALADLAATIVVFALSVASDNSSFYDPYWSVAPVPMILCTALSSVTRGGVPFSLRGVFVIVIVAVWAVRLTWNWARRWRGFGDEDWRYAGFRKSAGRWYWAVSFAGFHLFPTFVVFLALVPVLTAFAPHTNPFNVGDVIAILVCAGAIVVEAVTDEQLWRFRKRGGKKGRLLESGLWRVSRHPNYFGEILFWCGLFVFSIAAGTFRTWMIAGPAVMIFLFAFVSVPMADRRMKVGRPEYKERMKSVSALVPLPPQHPDKGETIVPLRKRPLDIVILGYLLFNLVFVSYVISIEQIVIPGPVVLDPPSFAYPEWPPRVCVEIVHWWEGHFDPLLLARPTWYCATIWIDVLLFGPFAAIAAYAFARGRNWIRMPAIVYSAIMFTNVTIILAEELWGPHAAANPLIPVLANASWFIFPFIIAGRMWTSDHPFTKRKQNLEKKR
jgi:steroid 5-alpha reductase family enzyme